MEYCRAFVFCDWLAI